MNLRSVFVDADVVIHLAAITDAAGSIDKAEELEANNFKSTIARIFENGINDSNLTEGRHINGLEVFIRRKVNEYGFRLAIKVLEELFCQRRLPKIVQISTALITEPGAHF